MSSILGEHLKLSIFGQSHGPAIGMTLDGLPAGLPIDFEILQHFLDRRVPGKAPWSSPRKESDKPEFLSGVVNGFTCGTPLTAVIYNQDANSRAYRPLADCPRPGHADFTAYMKYGKFHDAAGGGHFSGRLTAPLCIAGGLCLQWLAAAGIRVGAHITQIGTASDRAFDNMMPEFDLVGSQFATLSADAAASMQAVILEAHAQGDSVGGEIECAVTGLPAGIGEPIFGGVESRIAQIIYGIPGVKALSFGAGEYFRSAHGSDVNDHYTVNNGKTVLASNHCGGILGGITTGTPIIFKVVVKPTPSISKPQTSVNLKTLSEQTISVTGRHDPCIVPRAVPIVEAAAAFAIYDMILENARFLRK